MERRVKSLFLHSSLGQRTLPFIHSLNKYLFIIIFIIILPHCAAYRILVPRPGIEHRPPAVKPWVPITGHPPPPPLPREFPELNFLICSSTVMVGAMDTGVSKIRQIPRGVYSETRERGTNERITHDSMCHYNWSEAFEEIWGKEKKSLCLGGREAFP